MFDAEEPLSGAGRVPPNSAPAERGLLGAALLDAERVIDLAIERQIIPGAFYYRNHQMLWEVLLDMHSRSLMVDLLTVCDRLRALEQASAHAHTHTPHTHSSPARPEIRTLRACVCLQLICRI